MFPPIYQIAAADAGVKAVLGSPPDLFAFGDAPQGASRPYAVWQTISGVPENYLGQRPDMDSYRVQVDVYSLDSAQARVIAKALRDALEPHAHIVAWRGESRERETRLYRISFDVQFWEPRGEI